MDRWGFRMLQDDRPWAYEIATTTLKRISIPKTTDGDRVKQIGTALTQNRYAHTRNGRCP